MSHTIITKVERQAMINYLEAGNKITKCLPVIAEGSEFSKAFRKDITDRRRIMRREAQNHSDAYDNAVNDHAFSGKVSAGDY